MSASPGSHASAGAHDHAFDGEPVAALAADEPRTPGWLPALGGALFLAAAVWFLAISKGDDVKTAPSAEPVATAAPAPPPVTAAAAPAPPPRPAPPPPAPTGNAPFDLEKLNRIMPPAGATAAASAKGPLSKRGSFSASPTPAKRK